MRLDGALVQSRYVADVADAPAVNQLHCDACALHVAQQRKGVIQVHLQGCVVCALGGCGDCRLDVCGDVVAACVVVIHVVGYAEQPCGEGGCATECGQLHISLDESLLGEVVAQWLVAKSLGEEELPHPRLIFSHQTVEGALVVEHQHLRNQ